MSGEWLNILHRPMASIHEKHIALVEAVNNSKTEYEHRAQDSRRAGWIQGVRDCGYHVDQCAADLHYIDQGVDRPMCCGVWLDWEPSE